MRAMAAVHWPLNGASDVATDTPLVVWRYSVFRPTDTLSAVLRSSTGERIEWKESMRLTAAIGCGPSDYLFLRPARALEPGQGYELSIDTESGESLASSSFTTGDRPFEPEAAQSPDLQYLTVYQNASCTEARCAKVDEIRVDIGAAPARPLWLELHSDAPKTPMGGWTFWPEGTPGASTFIQLPIAPSDDGCIRTRLYGIEGRALFDETRCEPNRCAVYARSAVSSCGGPPFTPVDAARLSERSCERPPELAGPTGVVYPDDPAAQAVQDAGAATSGNTTWTLPQRESRDSGCSVSRVRSGGAAWVALVLLGLGLCRRRRRARAQNCPRGCGCLQRTRSIPCLLHHERAADRLGVR